MEHVLPDGQRLVATQQQCWQLGEVLLNPWRLPPSAHTSNGHGSNGYGSVPLPSCLASVVSSLPDASARKVRLCALCSSWCEVLRASTHRSSSYSSVPLPGQRR